jgi:hypothetical protein
MRIIQINGGKIANKIMKTKINIEKISWKFVVSFSQKSCDINCEKLHKILNFKH